MASDRDGAVALVAMAIHKANSLALQKFTPPHSHHLLPGDGRGGRGLGMLPAAAQDAKNLGSICNNNKFIGRVINLGMRWIPPPTIKGLAGGGKGWERGGREGGGGVQVIGGTDARSQVSSSEGHTTARAPKQ